MPRIRKDIALSNIVVDREPIGPSTLALVDHLRSGGTVPPIHVQLLHDGRYKILDGRHRVLAYKLLGKTEIEARFSIKTCCICQIENGLVQEWVSKAWEVAKAKGLVNDGTIPDPT